MYTMKCDELESTIYFCGNAHKILIFLLTGKITDSDKVSVISTMRK